MSGRGARPTRRPWKAQPAKDAGHDEVQKSNRHSPRSCVITVSGPNRSSRPASSPLRREILDRVLILREQHLRAVLTDHQTHYNPARPNQGMAQRVPDDERDAARTTVAVMPSRAARDVSRVQAGTLTILSNTAPGQPSQMSCLPAIAQVSQPIESSAGTGSLTEGRSGQER